MKIKLEKEFGFAREEGTTENFFGVEFVCQNKELNDNKFLSEWFADIKDKDAKEMEKAGRVSIIKD